jgi:hypothetical protein
VHNHTPARMGEHQPCALAVPCDDGVPLLKGDEWEDWGWKSKTLSTAAALLRDGDIRRCGLDGGRL